MPTPTGTISLSDVNVELLKSSTSQISLNDTNVRNLARILSGAISMDNLRGKPKIGTAWAWGLNTAGQVGVGDVAARSSPVSVIGGYTDWFQISVSDNHVAAIRSDKTAWTWGNFVDSIGGGNFTGKLGIGDRTARSSPVSVIGGFTDWVQISAGSGLTAAIRSNGTAWAWGGNVTGGLGVGDVVARSSPVSVIGGFTDWVQISAGLENTAAIRSNGTAWAWGGNTNGQVGVGDVVARSSPVSVIGGFTDWFQLSVSQNFIAAIRSNGTAWTWGINNNGQLGVGDVVARSSPVSVIGGFTDWVQISAGQGFAGAIRSNGTAWTWGLNTFGRLGVGDVGISRSSPVSVIGGFTDWVQISAGINLTAAIRSNGTAWTWGVNTNGGLGVGNAGTTPRSSPVSVIGGYTDWNQIGAGSNFAAAIRG